MKTAEILAKKFNIVGVEISASEITEQIKTQADEFDISEELAAPLVESEIIATHDLDLETYESTTATDVSYEFIEDVSSPDKFIQAIVIVDDLWDTYDDRIQQMGIVSDETGRIKFTVWDIAGQPDLEEGAIYHLWNVVVKEHNGELELKITAKSEIEQLTDGDFDVSQYVSDSQDTTRFSGVITQIEPGSGLIERCSVEGCTRVLKNGHCSEHGSVDAVDDLRVKAIVDNGTDHQRITLTTDVVETLLGFSVDDVVSHPDIDVDETIHDVLVAQYADCGLIEYDTNSYVADIELNGLQKAEHIEDLRDRADEMKYIL